MIFDTDVLIWCMRGNARAIAVIEAESERTLSVINYMELVQAARNKHELGMVRKFISQLGFRVIPLSDVIGIQAAALMEEFTLKSGLSLPDALVAATAVVFQAPLCTANVKHFRAIPDLDMKVVRPN